MKRLPSLLNSSHLRKVTAYLLVYSVINAPVWALTSANITSATNAAATSAAGTTTVGVTADKAVVNWNNFNTAAGETLAFERAGGGSFAVLNRISGSQTTFNGNLNGNQGHIIVVNTKGIVFGPTAQITAAGFVASGLNMLDADFMSGNYTFANGAGNITNKGAITAGQVALIGNTVRNTGTIVSPGGYIAMISGSEVVLGSGGSDVFVLKNVTPTNYVSNTTGEVSNSGTLDNPDGTVVLAAGDSFSQALDLDSLNPQAVGTVKQLGTVNADTLEISAIKSVTVQGDTTSGGDMKIRADKNAVSMGGNVTSGGDMSIEAGTNISLFGDTTSGGAMSITTHDEGTFSVGSFWAEDDIDLNTNLSLGGGAWEYSDSLYTWIWNGDQTIRAKGATVTANGWIHKETPGQLFILGGDRELSVDLLYSGNEWSVSNMGNIYILGPGDIQISGNLTGKGAGYNVWDFLEGKSEIEPSLLDKGGVSIHSILGSIYTAGAGSLDVTIEGYSNDIDGMNAGVNLPDTMGRGKSAIVLQSADTLTLGSHSILNADGTYISANDDPQNGIDDRQGSDYLDEIHNIGGYDRDPGIASDVAIYAASKTGNINVGGRVNVNNDAFGVSSGTVYLDAYDTVLIPGLSAISDGGYRLEVASRITEWLHEAIENGTLPYAYDPAYVEKVLGNDYVLRGAGDFVDYKDSTDLPDLSRGRAWVLEDLPKAPVAPLADLRIPEIKGCPVQLQAVAVELGVSPEDLQLIFGNAMASNPNLQPCEACAQVMTSATILKDIDGVRMAAMNQIFNTLAPANAPFTPEVSASVVTAFNQMAGQDRQYALAEEYVNAFVRYVAVLDTQIKAPVGDAVAFTLEKYGQSINPNINAFLMSKLQAQNGAM
jgi:filamentous hemagglutinin family protein